MKMYDCPEWVEALLRFIEEKMERVHYNKYQKQFDTPFLNTGAKYRDEVFEVSAYSWNDDDEDEINFRYKDICFSWYKHLGRCTMVNVNPQDENFKDRMIEMFDAIMAHLREVDRNNWKALVGGEE